MDAVRQNGFFGLAALLAVTWGVLGQTDAADYALIPGLLALVAVAAGAIQRDTRWGTVAASIVGLGASLYLSKLKLDAGGSAACDIDQTISCSSLNDSAWSEVAGVPIALFGAAYYVALIAGAVMAKRGDDDDGSFDHLNALLALAAVAYSVVLAGVSVSTGTFCIVCITMYLCNGLLLWAGLKGMAAHDRSLTAGVWDLTGGRDAGVLLAGFALTMVVGWNGWFAGAGTESTPVTETGEVDVTALYEPSKEVPLLGTEPVRGDVSAPITLVEFADFACPHCARAAKEIKDLLKMRDDLQVRFKPFPLTGKCNPVLEDYGSGEEKCRAAIAAECALPQGKYWEMSDQLFTNQGYFAEEQVQFMAKEIGLDLELWNACMASEDARAAVEAHAAAGGPLGIQGTPALYLNGLTADGSWVRLTRGVPSILTLLEARDDGAAFPVE